MHIRLYQVGHELVVGDVNVNTVLDPSTGHTALTLAAASGHCRFVELLLDMGSDINAQTETSQHTSLTLACIKGRHKVVCLLLDHKANLEHRAKTGNR